MEIKLKPDYIFETSWEVCNKVGGIYTVISTKAISLAAEYKDRLIMIGPDVWKETRQNPEFIEDKFLYKSWREYAEKNGLRFKIGRWNITGKPVAVLVDFTQFFNEKDKIFANFWETYQLDSLSGQWDYVEPALFGYAAGKVIESFYEFNIASHDKIVAQFHEWMTGTGILYLKNKTPQVGCIFTTHATVLGRCVAASGMPLYKDFDTYKPAEIAKKFDVTAKHSLEYLSALHADSFTTVSEITSRECEKFLGRPVDVITPNGFEDSIVPDDTKFEHKKDAARKKLAKVAEAVLNQKLSANTTFVVNSGRYEFKNKGIDIFIDSLSQLNKCQITDNVVAYIAVPANHYGPRKDILERLKHHDYHHAITDDYNTHNLYNAEFDAILKRAKEKGLRNLPEDKVKLIFVPSYLDGKDGIFNMHYYDLLVGFDVSVFPSYYEPWGYTPLESIAFHIPTITTSLTGFGLWVQSKFNNSRCGVAVINRTDENETKVTEDIKDYLLEFILKTTEQKNEYRKCAHEISRTALWSKLLIHYKEAYSVALEKVEDRSHTFKNKRTTETQWLPKESKQDMSNIWKKVYVQQHIPEKLQPLQKLSQNLWWCWNYDAIELFESIDSELWIKCHRNPVSLIQSLSVTKLKELEQDEDFITKLEIVVAKFDKYIAKAQYKNKDQVAYFSMEFGLEDSLQIFSGGLGILAGDYLKEASDSNLNIIGIGLLYRYGYFRQQISITGDQMSKYIPQRFVHCPINPVRDEKDDWMKVHLALPGRILQAKVWKVDVGRIPLYLLDTDIEENSEEDRFITHQLYGGNWENRFKQELLLGVGGIRLIDQLHATPELYHCNEGHAAFVGLERLRKLIQEQNLAFSEALEVVRASSLFTTHTPVPAGHDTFDENILRTYIPHYAQRLNISWETFMNLGKMNDNDPNEKFSMSVLAAKLSQEVNGVSRIHGRVSQEMFAEMYKGYFASESHISYVTNGVHLPTWTAKPWLSLYKKEFGGGFMDDQSNPDWWNKIYKVPDEKIWEIRQAMKKELFNYLKQRLQEDLTRREENPKIIFKIIESINENALTIGFARRFATYKRAHLLFSNLERLAEIVNNKEKPLQFVFAGKAHPHDKAGQDLIKKIIQISKTPEFIGKIIFIENYDIALAKKLVQGVDIWLNTPTRPLEASGTSGEKAIMNGVLNFSVLDGWWAEGYVPNAGWALKEERTYENQVFQDELDAETIYETLSDEILPLYYNLGSKEYSEKWIKFIKNNIAEICPRFTMKRMIDDYFEKFYYKMFDRSKKIKAEDFQLARQISAWKSKMVRAWESIEVISVKYPDSTHHPLPSGESFKTEIVLDTNEIAGTDIGIEVIFGQKQNDEVKYIIQKEEMKLIDTKEHEVTFACEIPTTTSGVYDFAFRVYPKNASLPHRLDFPILKWI